MRIGLKLVKASWLISFHGGGKQVKLAFYFTNRFFFFFIVMDVLSRPPEADREAELQGSNVVPVLHRDEQHFPGL